jgi:hypothetical protein
MRLIRAGEAALEALAEAGTVLAVFRDALYVTFPGGLVVLVGPGVEPGPLHAHLTALPQVSVGDPVGPFAGRPQVWRPGPLPTPGRIADTLRRVLDHQPDLDLVGGTGPAEERTLRATLSRGGLAAAASALAGRGPGLTPAGDDVLAGLLLAARAGGGGEVDLVAVAHSARTHEISRAYLAEAARGRSVAAAHDLMASCADGDVPGARRARDRLARVGHTSGLDLAYGVLVGSCL